MNLFVSRGSLARQMGVGDRANLLAGGPVLEARKLGRLGEQRDKLADWLMQWAPLIPLKMGTPRGGSQRDPASLAGRMAGLVRPGWGLPVPDPLALPWLQAWLDRGWLPEYTGSPSALSKEPKRPQVVSMSDHGSRWPAHASSWSRRLSQRPSNLAPPC